MKISILKESLCIGGTERSAANISVALAQKYDVATVLYCGDNIAYNYGGELYDMNLPPQKGKFKKIINTLKRANTYKKHLKRFKPDIVFQLVSFRSPLSRIRLKSCKKIVSSRDFSALSNNIAAYKKMLDSADAMICNSYYLRDYFIKKYPEDKMKVFTVQNIIDVNLINEQSHEETENSFGLFRENHRKLIVSVGRFCEEKAFDRMIEAFAKTLNALPETGLVLVGDGEYKEQYLKKIDELGISNSVYFTGYQKNPYKYMAKCDVFVLSSLSEGFPNVLAEAMALSLPVISVNCFTGPAEILMKNYDYEKVKENFVECDYGILSPYYGVKSADYAVGVLSEAMTYLLSDENLIKKYSLLSAERAADFSSSSAVKRLENIFENLVSRKL